MKILALEAENFKKLRVVQIRPDGKLIELTGRNGQGKTSVLDALWFGLKGRKALPLKPVRAGAEQMKVKLHVKGTRGNPPEEIEFTVTRTLAAEDHSIPTLHIEMLKGKRDTTPQEFLDDILGALTFDPLEFMRLEPREQVAVLRETAKVDIDFEAIAAANEKDYNERLSINREVKQLQGQLAAMTVMEGLPKKKVDESSILAKLNEAGERNRQAQEVFKAKQELGAAAAEIGVRKVNQQTQISDTRQQIERLTRALAQMEEELKSIEYSHAEAEKKYREAPAGELVDVGALTEQLQSAQRTNRAIDAREAYDQVSQQLRQRESAADNLTRQMEARDEKKRLALTKAKIPVEGIVFDERRVLFNGLPIENLGEGEQIRISAKIGMAANPKLRVLCIRHGEALDEDGLKILAELAEENDFQIWMARVDSSGKVGIVLEDGMIARRNNRVVQ
jgi:predicted ATP-dependent endonuclease of OLD family